jgi:thioredoxin reductase (NADPH)
MHQGMRLIEAVKKHEVIIIGGGPAGLTAGLYTSRIGLKTLLIERTLFGGQMLNARLVENYPGFPQGISGLDLGALMHEQAIKYGLETAIADVSGLVSGQPHRVVSDEQSFEGEAIIIAAGSQYRKLDVPGEETLIGRGVSYCATCDGPLFAGEQVAVIGGGDTAIADALEVSQHASKVYLIHRRDQLRAGQVLQQRAFAEPKIKLVWDTVVEAVDGDQMLQSLKLRNVKTEEASTLDVAGLFVAVGLTPNSRPFATVLNISETGHIITDGVLATSVPGIFAAGDIRTNSPRQIAGAVGDGATAALSVFRYLRG